jgi:hypothetical protein
MTSSSRRPAFQGLLDDVPAPRDRHIFLACGGASQFDCGAVTFVIGR